MSAKEIPFDQFMERWPRVYKQDQHVTVIGPTGCGKTTLVTELVKPRKHVVAFGVKHVDETMKKLVNDNVANWHRAQQWNRRPRSAERVVLWPKANDLDKVMDLHKKVFGDALRSIYKIGHWTIWMDELTYLADHAGLKKMIRQMYILARSNRISLVGGAQRPTWIPLEAYNQATHLILFRTGYEADLKKMSAFNGTSATEVARTVMELPKHYFLHVDLTNGDQVVSKAA